MIQRLIGVIVSGTGFYAIYLDFLIVGLILVAVGAGVFNGASHGTWFYIGGGEPNDKSSNDD